jgi:dienelactone hydrolase
LVSDREHLISAIARWSRLGLLFALFLVSGISAAVSQAESADVFRVPAHPFAGEPRGPFETGTFETVWVNEALEDPSTSDPNDKRKLIVQAWYPATPPKHPRRAPYAISPQVYGRDHWIHKLQYVQTQSILNAPMIAQPARLPILIYNHAAGQPHFTATFQMEFLASHGYFVISIGHPGANGIERFPDGSSYKNDGSQWMGEAPERDQRSPRDEFEYRWAHTDLSLFLEDITFVLDHLERIDADPKHRFHQRLDTDRVGCLGWSMGGFVALQAIRDEPRIKAAANLDGWPWGLTGPNGVATHGSDKPLLLMSTDWGANQPPRSGGEVDAAEVELWRAAYTHFWTMLRRSTADWYVVVLARSDHGHFSDLLLFEALDPSEYLNPRAAHAIINTYTLEFFNSYVRRGPETTPFLSGDRHFPEATLYRRKKAN